MPTVGNPRIGLLAGEATIAPCRLAAWRMSGPAEVLPPVILAKPSDRNEDHTDEPDIDEETLDEDAPAGEDHTDEPDIEDRDLDDEDEAVAEDFSDEPDVEDNDDEDEGQ